MGTPKIRFAGFTGDWEQRKLGDVAECLDNMRIPLNAEEREKIPGDIPYYGAGNIQGYINKHLFEEDLVLLLEDGDAFDDYQTKSIAQFVTGKSWVNNHAHVLRPKGDAYFLYSSLAHKDIRQWTQLAGASRKKLVQDAMLNIGISIPHKNEQNKVGSVFREIDKLIALNQRKCDELQKVKKYMLQKMFPKKGEKVPEIRFVGFTGDWEQRTFGEFAEYKKGPFGSALKIDLFVPRDSTTVKIYEQQNAIKKDWTLARYYITEEYSRKMSGFRVEGGDIIVSCAGTIGEIYELPDEAEPGIINQALMRVRVNESIVDKNMFKILFTNMLDDFTRVHSNGSAIKNIPPFSDLKPMQGLVPSMEEQRKISELFSKIDNLIALHQHKHDALKEIKKYMLQNMFPKE